MINIILLKMTSSTWLLCLLSSTDALLSPKSVQLSKGSSLVFIPTRPEVSSREFLKYHFSTDFQCSLTGPLDFNPKFLSTISNFLRGMVKTHQPHILKPNPFSFRANLPLPNSGFMTLSQPSDSNPESCSLLDSSSTPRHPVGSTATLKYQIRPL